MRIPCRIPRYLVRSPTEVTGLSMVPIACLKDPHLTDDVSMTSTPPLSRSQGPSRAIPPGAGPGATAGAGTPPSPLGPFTRPGPFRGFGRPPRAATRPPHRARLSTYKHVAVKPECRVSREERVEENMGRRQSARMDKTTPCIHCTSHGKHTCQALMSIPMCM